jgi:hypothetical protein
MSPGLKMQMISSGDRSLLRVGEASSTQPRRAGCDLKLTPAFVGQSLKVDWSEPLVLRRRLRALNGQQGSRWPWHAGPSMHHVALFTILAGLLFGPLTRGPMQNEPEPTVETSPAVVASAPMRPVFLPIVAAGDLPPMPPSDSTPATLVPGRTSTVAPERTSTVAPVRTPTVAPQQTPVVSTRFVGVPWNADGLSNVTIGRQLSKTSIRFTADRSATLTAAKFYFVFETSADIRAEGGSACTSGPNDCYGAGNGGQITIELIEDVNGLPSGAVLAKMPLTTPMHRQREAPVFAVGSGVGGQATSNFREIDMPDVALKAGARYHFVFSNVSAGFATNYISINHLWVREPTTPRQPGASDAELAVLQQYPGKGWEVRNELPIFEARYTDGSAQGIGYMDTRVGSPVAIGGGPRLRQRLTVGQASRVGREVAVRLKRNPGASAPLLIRLQRLTPTGLATVHEMTIAAASISERMEWVRAPLPNIALAANETYAVELSASTAGSYSLFPLQSGDCSYGFTEQTHFAQGRAEFAVSAGSTFAKIASWGTVDCFDLQLYLTVQ